MPASPLCQVKDGAGPWVATTDGVDVTPSNTISIRLIDASDVIEWYLRIFGSDDLTPVPPTLNNVNPLTNKVTTPTTVVTFMAPPTTGHALLFESVVVTNLQTISTTFGIYELADNGLRVGAVEETREGSANFGWAKMVNEAIRAIGSGFTAGGDLAGSSTSQTVIGLQGRALANTVPSVGNTLVWSGTQWEPSTSGGGFVAGGDLTGTNLFQTVMKLRGMNVPDPETAVDGYSVTVSTLNHAVDPRRFVVDPYSGDLWVVDNASPHIWQVSSATGEILGEWSLSGEGVTQIRDIVTDGVYLYVSTWDYQHILQLYMSSPDVVRGRAWCQARCLFLALDGSGNIYATVGTGVGAPNGVQKFSVSSMAFQGAYSYTYDAIYSPASAVRAIAYGGGCLWVTTSWHDNSVYKIDPTSMTLTLYSGPYTNQTHDVAYAFGSVWLTSSFDNNIRRVDPTTLTILNTIATGFATEAVGIGPSSTGSADAWVWVSSTDDNRVWGIDPSSPGSIALALTGTDTSDYYDSIHGYGNKLWVAARYPTAIGVGLRQFDPVAGTQSLSVLFNQVSLVFTASTGGFTAGGDLNGTSSSQTVVGIQGRMVATTVPTTGYFYRWSGSQWEPRAALYGVTTNALVYANSSGVPQSLVGTASGQVATWNGTQWTAAAPSGGGLPTATSSQDLVTWSGTAWVAKQPPAGIVNVTLGGTISALTPVILDLDRTGATNNWYVYPMLAVFEDSGVDIVANSWRTWRTGAPLLGRYLFDACAVRSNVALIAWTDDGLSIKVRTIVWTYSPTGNSWTGDYTGPAETVIYTGTGPITDIRMGSTIGGRYGAPDQAVVVFIENGRLRGISVTYVDPASAPTFGTVYTAKNGSLVEYTDITSFGFGLRESTAVSSAYFMLFAARAAYPAAVQGYISLSSPNNVYIYLQDAAVGSNYSFGNDSTNCECITVRDLGSWYDSADSRYGILYGSARKGVDLYIANNNVRNYLPEHIYSTTWNSDDGYRIGSGEPGFGDFVNRTWVQLFHSDVTGYTDRTVLTTGNLEQNLPVQGPTYIPPMTDTQDWGLTMVTVKQLTQRTFVWAGRGSQPYSAIPGNVASVMLLGSGRIADGQISLTPGASIDTGVTGVTTYTRPYLYKTDPKYVRTALAVLGTNRFCGVFSCYAWVPAAETPINYVAMWRGDDRECFFGILQESGVQGDVRPVAIAGGVSRGHTGLVVGARYYLGRYGLSPNQTPYPLGTAISSTELKIDGTVFNGQLWRGNP